MTTSMNERTHFFIKIYLSQHFILERVDAGCVWEVIWRRGQTATYWPHVLLTIAALLSHSGWAAELWVTEGPSPLSDAGSHYGIFSPTGTGTELTQAACGTWLYNCGRTHLHRIQPRPQVKVIFQYLWPDAPVSLFFCLFTQVHLLIDGSVEGHYVTCDPIICQYPVGVCVSHFTGQMLGCAYTICSNGQI